MKAVLVLLVSLVSSVGFSQNSAHLLWTGQEALTARLDLIEHSRNPMLSVFEMSEDTVGMAQLAALVDNARAGGHPRLLLDGLGHRLSHRTLQYLSSQNVEVRIFRAMHLIPLLEFGPNQALQRMHDKILSSDDEELVTGGRNSANKFFGRDPKGQNFIDYEVVLHGPVARAGRAYQEELWSSALSQAPYLFFTTPLDRSITEGKFLAARAELKALGWLSQLRPNWAALLTPVTGEFLHDRVTPDSGSVDGTQRGFLQIAQSVKKQLIIDANYFLLTQEEMNALGAAVKRGVDVQVVTNGQHASASITDSLIQEGFELTKPRLRALGITVREFQGPGRIHSKAVIADGNDCLIWSFNLDPRSRYTNYEAGVRLQSPVVCSQLATQIHLHLDSSLLTMDHGRQKVADRAICPAHEALIHAFEQQL
jgi:putative cardiolipin synthase